MIRLAILLLLASVVELGDGYMDLLPHPLVVVEIGGQIFYRADGWQEYHGTSAEQPM